MKYVSLLLLCCATLGCADNKTPAEKANHAKENYLPPNATSVQSLDNGWYTFKLEINGQEREFLYRHYSRGELGFECLTELQPR